jgi:hypothetical protein
MAALHKPSTEPGRHAVEALQSVQDRGHLAHYLAADRAYTNAKSEDFQLPARALGYEPVLDYRIDQLGVRDQYAGMLLIDGRWFCPAIPDVLTNATKDFREGKIDEATHRARLAERCNYAILPKSRPDAGGHVRVRCPASDPSPAVRCKLKPASEGDLTRGRTRIDVSYLFNEHPPRICTQQSVTLPPEAGAKLAQSLPHESDEWHAIYATLRNANEGMNGYLKDGAHQALEDPERRRVRGLAPQSLFVALLCFAANLRKIVTYQVLVAVAAEGAVRRLPRRRKTRDLATWRSASAGSDEQVPSDPDPPPRS